MDYKAQAITESSSTDVKYSMFIGRWQPLHKGHLWLINERLKEGKNVWLAIRDVKPDEKNPWTAREIEQMIREGELKDLIVDGRIVVSIIPDIESINYGRGVGYDVIEHLPPKEIGDISATSIRNKMRTDGRL
jgi:cytidyltransferase-like protein|tara:strand:+ start:2193 stop:2591 length:399 start_codon:yes stop_codon:yes gene_type:complete